MMSYMGSVGALVKGSGLKEALTTYYVSNTVEHMITGKAVLRTLRGTLVNIILFTNKLLTPFFPGTHDCVNNAEVGNFYLNSEE